MDDLHTPYGDLWLGDSLKRMYEIKRHSVDLILADLPYGVTPLAWDRPLPVDKLWKAYRRCIKPDGVIVLTGRQPFSAELIMGNREWFRYEWIWRKDLIGAGFLNAKKQPLQFHENILIFSPVPTGQHLYQPQGICKTKPQIRMNGRKDNSWSANVFKKGAGKKVKQVVSQITGYPKSVLQFKTAKTCNGKTKHRTQKPTAMFAYLIRTYSREGELVLDNTIGSGTTALAAIETGRRFLGIELDPNTFSKAARAIQHRIRAGGFGLTVPANG